VLTGDLCLSYGRWTMGPPVVTWPGTTTKKKKIVWYRKDYEWGGWSRVGPRSVADGAVEMWPSAVTYIGRSTSIGISGRTEDMSWCPKWGTVLERSGVGYVWYRCGSVEPSVRGGCVSESSRSVFNWLLEANLGVETAVACAWEVGTSGPRKSQKRNPAQFTCLVLS
jgi:hypothetical protein